MDVRAYSRRERGSHRLVEGSYNVWAQWQLCIGKNDAADGEATLLVVAGDDDGEVVVRAKVNVLGRH
jgi:hypothetical protein